MPFMRNKRTGEMVEVDASGTPVSRGPQMPGDPTFPTKGPQAVATLGKTTADTSNTNANTTRTVVQTQGDVLNNEKTERTLQHTPISTEDQAFINKMREGQGDLASVLRDITGAQAAVDRFQPSPGRGMRYEAGTAGDGDGLLSTLAKGAIGMFLPDDKQEAYQTLAGLQNQSVSNIQSTQAGPQTEADAIRYKLSGVSPKKDIGPNAQLLAEQQYDVLMKQSRPGFYETWANKLGSTHALNGQGKSADQVWNEHYSSGLQKMRGDQRYRNVAGAPKPSRSSDLRSAPRRASKVIDFNDLP